MTLKETSEIFSVLMLAYPNAEMFKGGIKQLAPTIKVWTQCLNDVDFWTAQQAVIRLCKVCKFPPSIAEFREQVDGVKKEIDSDINNCILYLRMWEREGTLEERCADLPDGSILAMVIAQLGGVSCLSKTYEDKGNKVSVWQWDNFRRQYISVVKANVLPGGSLKELPATK